MRIIHVPPGEHKTIEAMKGTTSSSDYAKNLWLIGQFYAENSTPVFLEQPVQEMKRGERRFLEQRVPEMDDCEAGQFLRQAVAEIRSPVCASFAQTAVDGKSYETVSWRDWIAKLKD